MYPLVNVRMRKRLVTPHTIRDWRTGTRNDHDECISRPRKTRVAGIMTKGTGLKGVWRAKWVGVRLESQPWNAWGVSPLKRAISSTSSLYYSIGCASEMTVRDVGEVKEKWAHLRPLELVSDDGQLVTLVRTRESWVELDLRGCRQAELLCGASASPLSWTDS